MSTPWFKCYPDAFISGCAGLTIEQRAFYVELIFRMYDAGDAIYADDRTIARWLSSNVRKWIRVRDSLVDAGKITILPNGAIINRRALREMAETCANSSTVPAHVCERLADLSIMFDESFENVSPMFRETFREIASKTRPLIEARSQKLDDGESSREKNLLGETVEADKPKPKPKAKPKAPRTRLDPNWTPNQDQRKYALEQGVHPTRLDDFIADFVEHFSSPEAKTYADHNKCWRGSCRRNWSRFQYPRKGQNYEQQSGNVANFNGHRHGGANNNQRAPGFSGQPQHGRGSAASAAIDRFVNAVEHEAHAGRNGQEYHPANAHAEHPFGGGEADLFDADGNAIASNGF